MIFLKYGVKVCKGNILKFYLTLAAFIYFTDTELLHYRIFSSEWSKTRPYAWNILAGTAEIGVYNKFQFD